MLTGSVSIRASRFIGKVGWFNEMMGKWPTYAKATVDTPPSLKLRWSKGEIAQMVRAHDS